MGATLVFAGLESGTTHGVHSVQAKNGSLSQCSYRSIDQGVSSLHSIMCFGFGIFRLMLAGNCLQLSEVWVLQTCQLHVSRMLSTVACMRSGNLVEY